MLRYHGHGGHIATLDRCGNSAGYWSGFRPDDPAFLKFLPRLVLRKTQTWFCPVSDGEGGGTILKSVQGYASGARWCAPQNGIPLSVILPGSSGVSAILGMRGVASLAAVKPAGLMSPPKPAGGAGVSDGSARS